MKKKKLKDIIIYIIFFISVGLLIYSSINIVLWLIDNNSTKNVANNIQKDIEIEEVIDSDKTEIIEQKEEIKKEDPYWDYIKLNLIDVDISKLKEKNNDTVGWIRVEGTNVNYPFVQTKDNDYYLKHSFDKSKNQAGWVFLDYRNDSNFENKNTIIYAHGRYDNTMFGSLKQALKKKWLNNKNNHVVKVSTEKYNLLYQVFSIYSIPTTTDYLTTAFYSNESFISFTNMIKKRSIYNFNTSVSENDTLLTLSTCLNKKEKVVLHAKLIKRELR